MSNRANAPEWVIQTENALLLERFGVNMLVLISTRVSMISCTTNPICFSTAKTISENISGSARPEITVVLGELR